MNIHQYLDKQNGTVNALIGHRMDDSERNILAGLGDHYTCAECLEPIVGSDVNAIHDHDGEDVHAECCPVCNPTSVKENPTP